MKMSYKENFQVRFDFSDYSRYEMPITLKDSTKRLVIFVGYRGWHRDSKITDSAAKFTLPILNAWGIKSYLIEEDIDCKLISNAFIDAEKSSFPVACLIGAEYSH